MLELARNFALTRSAIPTLGYLCQCTPCASASIGPQPLGLRLRPKRTLRTGERSYSSERPGDKGSIAKPPSGNEQQRSSGFQYRVSAAFSKKKRPLRPDIDVYNFSESPAPSSTGAPSSDELSSKARTTSYLYRRPDSGQDAYFISHIGQSSQTALGVADGVGGWDQSGIDSGLFSRGICSHMMSIARSHTSAPQTLTPQNLLGRAYKAVLEDRSIPGGGSTACVAIGRSHGVVEIANLGDSGYILLRSNAVHYRSEAQTHAFNTPYQLSRIPAKMLAQTRLFGGQPLMDKPSDSVNTVHEVVHGDVLIFATDGVWDNLNAQEILRIVSQQMIKHQGWTRASAEDWARSASGGIVGSDKLAGLTQPGGTEARENHTLQSLIAMAITAHAKAASVDQYRDGPFAREVQRRYPHERFHGGKADDICVVVAVVVKDPERTST